MTATLAVDTPPVGSTSRCRTALDRAVDNLRSRQREDGHWAGDYGGPMFLLPGLLIACEITGTELTDYQRSRQITYLRNVQNPDGGFGLHVEDRSTVFGTALNYVAMRILGLPAADDDVARARRRLIALGGAERIPTWGKFWLAAFGVYKWEGINPLLPELYLLPRRFALHPSNFWCHTRQVFLPMSYIYARRLQGPTTPLVEALREEMFAGSWSQIDWPSLREDVAPVDTYTKPSIALRLANRVLSAYENRAPRWLRRPLRKRAVDFVMDQIHHEDESTAYLTIGPVSKAIQMLAVWFEDPDSDAFRRHVERIEDYLWDGVDGMKMQGYNGSQFWDTAFASLAILDSGLPQAEGAFVDVLRKAHDFVDDNQVKQDVADGARYYRDPIRGSWPFSTAEQAWTVSDCTAEGIKVAVGAADIVKSPISTPRLTEAVDVLVASQNDDGGWSEYERSRAPRWAELFNAAEVFGDIMRGYSYVECTSACVQGLLAFAKAHPGIRGPEIDTAVVAGLGFIRQLQRDDGSWYGGWGVCFTYGTWFGIDALVAGGSPEDRQRIVDAAGFLADRQRDDGGWGESYRSCVEHRWVESEQSLPVQSAWALLGLITAYEAAPSPALRTTIEAGVEYLLGAQTEHGDWEQQAISGVFNRNCMIHYDNYRHVMPFWALSRYYRVFA